MTSRVRWLAGLLVVLVVAAGCSGDDDRGTAESDGADTSVVDDDQAAASSQVEINEDVEFVCANWRLMVPSAPRDVASELSSLLGSDTPAGVADALDDLSADDRDDDEVRGLLVQVAGYVDPICGTNTPGTLDSLAAPAACPDTTDPELDGPTSDPVDTAIVDIDLDGADDTAVLYLNDDATLLLEVSLGAGGVTSLRIEDEMLFTEGPLRVETAADVEGDGDADLWLVIGSGASTELYTLILAEPCGLVRPSADGVPNAFSVGASVGNVDGLECIDLDGNGAFDGFEQFRGESSGEPGTYDGQVLHWVVDGQALVLLDNRRFSTGPDDDERLRYGTFTCVS